MKPGKRWRAKNAWLTLILVSGRNLGSLTSGDALDVSHCRIAEHHHGLGTKDGEKRTVPLNRSVLELLRAREGLRRDSAYVFTSQAGTKLDGPNVHRAFDAARRAAGLEDVRFHDLRHSFATRLVQAGVDLYVVKELLGHKTLAMTTRYAHHYPESLRHGVEVLDRSGYDLVTFGGKRGEDRSAALPYPIEKKENSMVGDVGFEPTTSAV
ncbi:MAG: site-specific integrase [Nitrospirota bacterium]